MANGDRLTGTVLEADRNTVVLKTVYAGTIAIERGQVQSLHRDPTPARNDTVVSDVQQRTVAQQPTAERTESGKASAFASGSEFSGRINVALSSDKGNSEQTEIDLDYELGYRRGWHRAESIGSFEFDTDDGDRTTDNWSTYNRYSRHFPSRWYAVLWLALKHDRFADLRLRTLGGPALGYLAFEGEALNLSVEVGPMVLREDFYGQSDNDLLGPGWFLNYDQLVWKDRVQLYHRQFGYLALSGEDKRLWQAWTGLRVPLSGGFTGSVEFEYDFDSAPAMAAKTTDTTLRLKLGYQW